MKIKLFLTLFIIGYSLVQAQNNSDVIVGKWLDHTKEASVEIHENNGKYYGEIIWLNKPNDAFGKPRKDKENSTSKLRNRALLGLEVLSNLEFINDRWENGKMYSIKKGRTGNCTVYLKSSKVLSINISTPFGIKKIKWTKL